MKFTVIFLFLRLPFIGEASIVSKQMSASLSETDEVVALDSVIMELLKETLKMMEVKHLILITPQGTEILNILSTIWEENITFELYMDSDPENSIMMFEWTNINGSASKQALSASPTNNTSGIQDSLWEKLQWDFLYTRDIIPRSNTIVFVVGSSDWVFNGAVQMMLNGVFGAFDSMLLVPLNGEIDGKLFSEIIPIGVRVSVIRYNTQEKQSVCAGIIQHFYLADYGRYVLRNVGCWHKGKLTMNEPLMPVLTTLKGFTLKTAIIKGYASELTYKRENGKLILGGYLATFYLNKIRKKLNFDLDIIETDGGYGKKTSNGSFDGVVGFIQRRDIDFGSAILIMRNATRNLLDYAEWLFLVELKFITQGPTIKEDPFILFQIYHWKSWLAIAGFVLCSSVMLNITWRPTPGDSLPYHFSGLLQSGSTTIMKAILYQGSVRLPCSTPGRLVLVTSWIVIMILVAVYNGNLTAYLSIPRISKPPDTVRQLVDRGYTLSISNALSTYQTIMESSPFQSHQEAAKLIEFRNDKGLMPDDIYAQRAYDEPLAIIVHPGATPSFLDKYTDKVGTAKVCTLQTSTELIFQLTGTLGFKKNSAIKHLFDQEIVWVKNTKVMSDIIKPNCLKPTFNNDDLEPLGMIKFGGVMVLWGAGLWLSLMGFVAEKLIDWTNLTDMNA